MHILDGILHDHFYFLLDAYLVFLRRPQLWQSYSYRFSVGGRKLSWNTVHSLHHIIVILPLDPLVDLV